jgi:rubrerythrin
MPISKLEARELMSRGYEMGAAVLNGRLERRADGVWAVDGRPIEEWLRAMEGREVAIVAAEITEGASARRICRVCGTEYEGHECPRCRQVRQRLRGRT